jgi:hypothetical protein
MEFDVVPTFKMKSRIDNDDSQLGRGQYMPSAAIKTVNVAYLNKRLGECRTIMLYPILSLIPRISIESRWFDSDTKARCHSRTAILRIGSIRSKNIPFSILILSIQLS